MVVGNRWLCVWRTAIPKTFQKLFILSWANGNMITWLESRLFPTLLHREEVEENFTRGFRELVEGPQRQYTCRLHVSDSKETDQLQSSS